MAYYKCSHCEKYFTSKKKRSDHERKVHHSNPAAEQQVNPITERNVSESETTMEQVTPAMKLEIKKPPDKEETKEPEPGYHCVECGASLRKWQKFCPNCGVKLDWGQV